MQKHGNDLNAFCKRTEIYNEDYAVSISGFIAENDKYTKFFHIDGHDIMIRLGKDKKNRITALDIVLPKDSIGTDAAEFCKNCIMAFVNDDKICEKLKIDEIIKSAETPSPQTKTTDAEGIGVNVDSLDAGTVITVYFEE